MDETEFAQIIGDALFDFNEDEIKEIRSFEEAGLMTHNRGVVVYMEDGSSYQVTVVRDR